MTSSESDKAPEPKSTGTPIDAQAGTAPPTPELVSSAASTTDLASPSSTAAPATAPPKMTPLPDVGDIIFLAMIAVTLFMRPTFVFGDGSTGWHLATGEWVLKHGAAPQTDFLSVNFADKPWVAYEWLSDTIMAFLVSVGGTQLLGVAVCSAISILFLLIYEKMRKEGCHFVTALVITIVGAFTSAVHWLARPHLFTFFGVYIFSTRLEDRYRGTISGAKFFVPLILYMLIWVNCHPAFLIGLALIGLYWTCSVICAVIYDGEKRTEFVGLAKDYTIAGVVCSLLTFATPYGIKLHQYIYSYLKGGTVIQATDEYMSPNFHGALSPICLEILFALLIIGLAITTRRLTFPKLSACIVFAHLALSSVRHMPLFAIVSLPALGELMANVKPISVATTARLSMSGWWTNLVAKLKEVGEGFNENEAICQMHIVPVATVLALSAVAIFARDSQILTSDFDAEDKPWYETHISKEKPAGTLNYLVDHERSHDLKPSEGFNFDNYGGYLYYAVGRAEAARPKDSKEPPIVQKVFIDDRADFYGENYYKQFAIVSQVEPGYEKVLSDHKVNWILFPNNSRLVAALKQNPAWENVSHDKAATLFVRRSRI